MTHPVQHHLRDRALAGLVIARLEQDGDGEAGFGRRAIRVGADIVECAGYRRRAGCKRNGGVRGARELRRFIREERGRNRGRRCLDRVMAGDFGRQGPAGDAPARRDERQDDPDGKQGDDADEHRL